MYDPDPEALSEPRGSHNNYFHGHDMNSNPDGHPWQYVYRIESSLGSNHWFRIEVHRFSIPLPVARYFVQLYIIEMNPVRDHAHAIAPPLLYISSPA